MSGRPPNVVAVGPFHLSGFAPAFAAFRVDGIAEVLVEVVILTRKGVIATPPSSRIDEELVLKN